MKELLIYIGQLTEIYNRRYDNDKKHELASELWTKYYKRSKELGISLEEAYNLSLMCENESYIINQPPIRYDVDDKQVANIVSKLKKSISINEESKRLKSGITLEEADTLLKWSVENTRKMLNKIVFNIEKVSLNGQCELAQALSLLPFENIGLYVTKNRASLSFGYPNNHAFGSVIIPIEEDGKILEKLYLIDVTYRQFFSTVRCNEGKYYDKHEDGFDISPDPGYFVEDKEFAKELMGKGYIELTGETAKKYGEPFYLSSLKLNETSKIKYENYLNRILEHSYDYSLGNLDDLDVFSYDFPIEEVQKEL